MWPKPNMKKPIATLYNRNKEKTPTKEIRDHFILVNLCHSIRCPLPGMLFLQIFGQEVTIIKKALDDFIIVNNLLVHVLEEFNLFPNKLLDSRRVELAFGTLLITHETVHVPETVLEYLESILRKLQIELTKV